MTLRLILESGGPVGTVYELSDGENVIGRSSKAHIQVVAGDVSRGHVCIHVADGQAVIENLSRFGSALDDQPLETRTPLADGQHLQMGQSTVFVFRSSDAPIQEEGDLPTSELLESAVDALSDAHSGSQPARSNALPVSDLELPQDEASEGAPLDTGPADSPSDSAVELVRLEKGAPAEEIEDPPSGHIDMFDGGEGDDVEAPPSLAGIDMDDLIGRPSAMAPVTGSADAIPSPEDELLPDEEDGNGPHTQMMSTRAIDYLRTRQEKAVRIRTVLWFAGSVLALLVATWAIWRLL